MSTQFKDAAPVAVSGQVGSTMSLYDFLLQSYGGDISSVQSVYVNVANVYGSYWDPAAGHTADTRVVNAAGHDISAAGETVSAADFKNVQIVVGNNINSNVFVTVPENSTWDTTRSFAVTALPQHLAAHPAVDHVPTAADIVSAATSLVKAENATAQSEGQTHIANVNDCHGIASAIAASAGATLGQVTGNTDNLAANPNQAGGFWRIAYTDGSAGNDWQSKVQAGDIVRMERTDGGVHTVTVVAGVNADGQHPGQIETVDNWNGVISQHWANYNDGSAHNTTIASSVTVYRLASDGQYLIDQSADTHNTTVVGDNFNDRIKLGSGNVSVAGGAGVDTAALAGNRADYQIVHNVDGSVSVTGHGVTDKLTSIEKLQFNDQTIDLTAPAAPPAPPAPAPVAGSIAINDVSVTEGADGSKVETFTVTRTGGSAAFDVHFTTADGSATTADHDYVAKSGNLHFDAGVNTQTISITFNGDTKVEGNETFSVNLSGASNGASIAHAQGIGTIVNDDTTPMASHAPTEGDFNGDGNSDILFRNTHTGSVALWELNGNHITSNTTVGSAGLNWHADGIGDFNGDGKSDVLWTSDKGQVAMWEMNGDHIASNTTVGQVGAGWHVAQVADFNGDGKSDVLWQNDNGKVALWEMDGDHIKSNTTVGSVGSGWHIEAAADFSGDGKADILWQNASGKVAMWQMDGDHVAANTTVGSVGSTWHVAGADDFNGDGKADVLWQNDKGQVSMWQMNGDHIAANTTVGSASGWNVVATGDVNHDGKADVLFQNASGHIAEWQMNGDHIAQNLTVGSVSSDWHMV